MTSHNSDTQRILMAIAIQTAGTVHDRMMSVRLRNGQVWTVRTRFDYTAPQFVPMEMSAPRVGDVVRCKTNPNHHCGIAFYEGRDGDWWLLREIGGSRRIRMGNESLDVLRFMPESDLYEGHRRTVYEWLLHKALNERFNPAVDSFEHRPGRVVVGPEVATVSIRSHSITSRLVGKDLHHRVPFFVEIPWTKRTRLKDLIGAVSEGIRAHGGAWEYESAPPRRQDGSALAERIAAELAGEVSA